MKWTVQGYVRFLRRSHVHLQHVHAFVFAFAITIALASLILYYGYGFWHQKYDKEQVLVEQKIQNEKIESPTDMFSSFVKEAKDRVSNIQTMSSDLFKSKEVYSK